MNSENQNPFSVIVDSQLSSVIFVKDYIQLDFNGHLLTALIAPSIKVSNAEYNFGESGYRDALCLSIGKIVRNVPYKDNEEIQIIFEDGSEIRVALLNELKSGETALFRDGKNLYVWN